jgi:hypothetical protein
MRKWSIKLVAVGPNNTEVPATFIEKVTYKLHPTFEKPTRGIISMGLADDSDKETAVQGRGGGLGRV